jgi:hypothetical protein
MDQNLSYSVDEFEEFDATSPSHKVSKKVANLTEKSIESASVYSADFTATEENPAKIPVLQEKSYLSEYSQDFGAPSPTQSRLEGGNSYTEGSKKIKTASGENSRYQDDDDFVQEKSSYTASSGQFHKDSASYAEDKYEDDYTPLNSITKLEQTQEQPEPFPMSNNISNDNNLPDSPVIHARAGSLLDNPSVDYGDEGFDFENKSSLSLKQLSKNDPIHQPEEEKRQAQSSQKSVKAPKTEITDDDAVDPDLFYEDPEETQAETIQHEKKEEEKENISPVAQLHQLLQKKDTATLLQMPSLDSSSESTEKKPTKKKNPPTEIHSHGDQLSQNSQEQHEKTTKHSLENNSQVKSVITLGTGEQSDEGKINAMVMGNDEDETDSFLFFDQEHEAEEDQKETQMMENMKEFVRKSSEVTFKYQTNSQENIQVFKGDELAVLQEESSIASSIVSKRENNNQKTPSNNEVLQANIEKRGSEEYSVNLQKQKSSGSSHSPVIVAPIVTATPGTVQASIADDISRLKGLLTEDGMDRVKRISKDFMNNVFQAASNSSPSSPVLFQTLKNEFYEPENVGKQGKEKQDEHEDDLEITYQLEKETQETLRQYNKSIIEQQESSDTPEKQSKPVHETNDDNYHEEEEEQPFVYHREEVMNSGDELLYDDKNEQITTKKVAPLRPVTTGSNQAKKPVPSSSSTRPASSSKQAVASTAATTSVPMTTAERAKSAPSKPKPKVSADPLLAGLEQYTGPPPSLQQKQHQQQQSKPKERASSSPAHQKTSQPSSSAVSQLRSAVASSQNTGTNNKQQQAQMKQYDREQMQKMKLKEFIMSKPNNPIRFDSHECRIVLTETCIHRKQFSACSSSFCKEAYNKFQWLKLIRKKTELAIELIDSADLLWRKKLQSSLDNALDALELEQEEEVSEKLKISVTNCLFHNYLSSNSFN